MADVGEIEYHRDAEELVAPLVDDGSAPGDDDLGEVVVKGHLRVAKRHGRVAINDERRQSGYVKQPALTWHVVIAIARPQSDVRHLHFHFFVLFYLGVLPLPRCG